MRKIKVSSNIRPSFRTATIWPTVAKALQGVLSLTKRAKKYPKHAQGANFSRYRRRSLQNILISSRRRFNRVFRYTFDTCDRREVFVEFADGVADSLSETALDDFHRLNLFDISFFRVCKDKSHARHTMWNRRDIFLASYQFEQFFGIRGIPALNGGTKEI